jgi:hypothetical protein
MSRNRLIIIFALVAVLCVGLIVVVSVVINANRQYQASQPTPTPTLTPLPDMLSLHCLGGQVYLNDAEIKRILREEYRLDVTVEAMGSFQMVAPETDYSGVDCVWTGSKSAYDALGVNHPGAEVAHETVFVTFLMNFTWENYLKPALEAGIVRQEGSAYVMDMAPVARGMLEEKTWADLGVPEIPSYVNMRFSAPESSGGGLSSLALLGAYLTPRTEGAPARPIRDADLSALLPDLAHIWEVAGQQSDSSPENFEEFRTKGWPWAISSESLFLGYLKSLPPDQQQLVTDNIIGVYPEYTMSTDHVLVCVSQPCLRLLEAFRNDVRLQQIGWDNYGMRLGVGGVGAKPGDTDIPWILPNPQFIPDPKQSVMDAIQEAIKQ